MADVQSEHETEPQNCDDLKAAIGKTKEGEKGRQQYLVKRSVELGCVEHIPDDWEVEVNG
jgi:hypothetical protein